MEYCGVVLDLQRNQQAATDQPLLISAQVSKVKILAIPTDEEYVIAQEGLKLMAQNS